MEQIKIIACFIFLLSTFCVKVYAQDYTGKYKHNFIHNHQVSSIYYESMELKSDGTFEYCISFPGYKDALTGNWQVRYDSILVLDSKRQRCPTLVTKKKHRNKSNHAKISVFSPSGMENGCCIYVVNNNDTTEYYHNYSSVRIKAPFDYFFLRDYIIQSHNIKYEPYVKSYRIVFQQSLVFNDEHWIIKDGYIKTKGSSGIFNSYLLRRLE